MNRIAVVPHSTVMFDKDASIKRASALIEEAAGNGARLVVFAETFIPGYPAWIWRLRPGGDWGI